MKIATAHLCALVLFTMATRAHAQDMRAACAQTRRQVATGQVTCDQIRQNRAAVQQNVSRSEQNARQTAGAQSFSRLHSAAATAGRSGIACYDSILSSGCGQGAGAGGAQAERAAIQRMEQQQRQFEQQMAQIQQAVQAQMQVAEALTQYVEQHMPWLISDEERERLAQAGSQIRAVGSSFDARSRDSDAEIEALQRRFGVELPPGTRIEQVGRAYVLRDANGVVLYRLQPGPEGFDLVPTNGQLNAQDALLLRELARRNPNAALLAQLIRDPRNVDPALAQRGRMIRDLARRTRGGNEPIDGSNLEDVIDFGPAPTPPAQPEQTPAPEPELPIDPLLTEDALAPAPEPELPAVDPQSEIADAGEVQGGDELSPPLDDDAMLETEDASGHLDTTGTQNNGALEDEINFGTAAGGQETQPVTGGADGTQSDGSSEAGTSSVTSSGEPVPPSSPAPFDHEQGVRLGTEPPSREPPTTFNPGPNPAVIRAIEELNDEGDAAPTSSSASSDPSTPSVSSRAREALGWADEQLHDATDRVVRVVQPVVESAREARSYVADLARIVLPGGQHEWMADTVMWRFGEVAELDPNPQRPINEAAQRELREQRRQRRRAR